MTIESDGASIDVVLWGEAAAATHSLTDGNVANVSICALVKDGNRLTSTPSTVVEVGSILLVCIYFI